MTTRLEIPILTLTDMVLFPRTLLSLRITEPSQRQLVEAALEREGEIGVILLQPGWGWDSAEKPKVFQIGGMGVIVDYQAPAVDEIEVIVQGLHRFVVEEHLQVRPYRTARVRLLNENIPLGPDTRKVSRLLVRYFNEVAKAADSHSVSLSGLKKLDYHTLVNSICAWLNFSVYEKQRLLELEDVCKRGEEVLRILKSHVLDVRLISRFRHLQPEDARFN
mgnify:CR=1 FL=1